MPIYKIRGIDVDFPYDAYDCQLVYMDKVIQSLQQRCHALLESPTGTGKTLCLLCATLAWRKSLGAFSTGLKEDKSRNISGKHTDFSLSQDAGSNLPVIIYTSRTHSQLQQVIRELKASNYRPKMMVLGSREQMCVHDDVQILRGRAQNNACHVLCKKHSCSHHSRVPGYLRKNPDIGNDPLDIEDLVNIGRTQGPCPYYISRELHKSVDILFAPYNYLVDPGNRRSLTGIQWHNAVLIFDEAHNLESICADAASFDLPSSLLAACVTEAKECVDLSLAIRTTEKSDDKSLKPDTFAILRALLLKLQRRIAEVPIESKELGFTRPGPYIYELLADLNITHETAKMLIDTIDDAASLLEDAAKTTDSGDHKAKGSVCRLESIKDILQIIFRNGDTAHAEFYRVHVQESLPNATDAFKVTVGKVRTLSWWCFNPGIAMEEFVRFGAHSIILTSGTLSPLDSFALELNLDFPVRLENPHVISSNQVWVGVVPSGPSGCSFNSSYRNRDSLEYKQELGNAIVNFARIVPDGLLVFFPSYYLLNQCIECWQNMSHASSTNSTTIWERICKHKQPVVEPKQSAFFSYAIEDFNTKLKDTSTSGAIFFAVCRGKVSEGLDFADSTGRAVVITGMPFAMRTDPKIRLKREYLDQQALSRKKESKVLTGEEWYGQQATRAVNQAIGRVIRHRNDYGAIILCDERFAWQSIQCQMSLWLRPHLKSYYKFGDVVFTLTRFFRDMGKCGPMKPKPTQSMASSDSILVLESSFDEGTHKPPGKDIHSISDLAKMPSEKSRGLKTSQPQDNIFCAMTTHLTTSLAGDCKKPLSSVLAATRGSMSNQLGEVVPANRSTLHFDKSNKHFALNQSRDAFFHQSRSQTGKGERKGFQYQECEVVDLTSDSPLNELSHTEEIIVSCSSKKQKVPITDSGTIQQSENYVSCEKLYTVGVADIPSNSSNSQKHYKQTFRVSPCGLADICDNNTSTQHAQVSSGMVYESSRTTQKIVGCLQKNEEEPSSSTPCGDEETRGSAFLIQVQEKLSTAEYKDFVGFMKALKSKTMKIIPVLESIAKLFSGPERLVLLKRFKDYVPAKYHLIYDQHIRRANDEAVASNEESNRRA